MEGKVCTKCKQWKALEEYHKRSKVKDGRQSQCKECRNKHEKQYYENNAEYYKQYRKDNAEHYRGYNKQHYKDNAEYLKEYLKQYRKDNKEKIKEQRKQYRKDNAEKTKEYNKQYYKNETQENLKLISNTIKQTRPILKDLPIYGSIYLITNTKTGRTYIGQTIKPLKHRYKTGIINSWIKERKEKLNQKFKDELIEEDFTVTEILDVACCKYHLNILEAYWINYYDSYNNGYNNTAGNHITDDGIEEFNQILKENNLQFINGQLLRMEA